MGGIKQEWLDTASFSQNTQSTFQGKKTSQYFFKWEDRFKIFKNRRLPGTTIDIRTQGGQVVLYRPLPPAEIWEDLNQMPEDLFKALCAQLKEKPKDDWKEGNRNNTLFKKVAMDMENNQGRNVPSIMDKAIKVGLSKSEVKKTAKSAAKTALQGNHGIDPGPELNGAGPPKEKATSGIEWVTAPKVQPTAKWLLPDFIPFGAYSVWAGPTGKGRTTTLLNILTLNARGEKLPGTDQKGDKRPFLYHGPENALSIIQKRVKDADGDLNKHIKFLQMTKDGEKLPEMTINNKDLQKELIRAIESKEFSAVVCDTIYLLLKDQNHNAGDVLLPIAQACQRAENTACIGVAHLKKHIARSGSHTPYPRGF